MFQELMPLLAQRVLLLTVSRVNDKEIRINIIPKPLKADQRDDDAALTTPLGVTATPKDLDEQLPGQLVEFAEAHLGLSSTLRSAKEQIEAAAKAAREAAKKLANTKSHAGSGKSASPGSARVQAAAETKEKSADSQSCPESVEVPAPPIASVGADASTGSLFDMAPKDGG